MKTKPQDGARSVFVKSCADKMDLTDAIERYKSNAAPPRIGITFVGSEAEFEELSNLPTNNSHQARYCSSLGLLLRSGLYQESNLFVLAGPTHIAEQADVEQILAARSDAKIKVVVLPEGTVTESARAIDSAVEEIELWAAKKSITNDILKRSPKLAANEGDERFPTKTPPLSELQSEQTKEALSEDQFKELIAYKLNEHLESSPDNILSKAIDIIKR